MIQQVKKDFSSDASLAVNLTGYTHRAEQVTLAGEIAESFEQGNILLAEAETGTGKTLAYLVPALRLDGKVLISTHTRSLQNQLMHRDIPAVMKAMGVYRKVALLKGRSNYVCPSRLTTNLASVILERWQQKPMLRVMKWSEKSTDGDLSGLPFDVFEKGIGALV
ncbi:MAG: DEAD/DEAH box helicase, partial [Mariprofundaceae bacterium]|nr:DEAD/DEAH box helicase [Mariprofundaceae bacterium]